MTLRYIGLTILCILLTGCFEIDDSSSDNVAAAINNQNQTLQDQNELLQGQSNPTVTLFGTVVNALGNEPVSAATLSVSVAGTTILDNVTAMQGDFQLPNIPAESSILILISSETNEFLTRAFYLTTGTVTSEGAQSDIGRLAVSEGIDVAISVRDENNGVVAGLQFEAFSHSGTGSNFLDFAHRSEFNESTGQYSITVPRYLFLGSISANIDLDRNGTNDFFLDSNTNFNSVITNNRLALNYDIGQTSLAETLTRISTDNTIEFRVSILDDDSSPLTTPTVSIRDSNAGSATSTFDSDTNQHVITSVFDGSVTLLIPSFTESGTGYRSSQIQVTTTGGGFLSISSPGLGSSNVERTNVINLVAKPSVSFNTPEAATVVLRDVDDQDSAYRVFYSEPVQIDSNQVTLSDTNGSTIIRGNDSETDSVNAGTSLISRNKTIPINVSLGLGATLLNAVPSINLEPLTSYNYGVGNFTTLRNNTSSTSSQDDLRFDSPRNNALIFSIDDVVLDNNNFTTNGSLIVPSTTDGTANSASDNSRTTLIVLPLSITNLQSLSITLRSSVNNGVSLPTDRTFEIVRSGFLQSVNKMTSFQLAENETISGSTFNILLGSTVPDTETRYTTSSSISHSDNTGTSTNTVTFEYSFVTREGVSETGTVTKPVL